jgi:hypothetical protein
MERHGDAQVVDGIMQRRIWQRTRVVETCKYQQMDRNRFRSRVVLENGMATGWQQRQAGGG